MPEKSNYIYQTQTGIVISIKLIPNSSYNKIIDYTDEYIRIKISSPPVENKANNELISFLSNNLSVNKSKIKIINGEKSKLKKVLIEDKNIQKEDIMKKIMFMLDSEYKKKKDKKC